MARTKQRRPRKVCAFRKSKAHPNVYLRKELVSLALKKGATKKMIRGMKKPDLCRYLGKKYLSGARSKVKKPSKTKVKKRIRLIFLDKKGCNVRRSKLHPDAYLKSELVEMAMKKLKMKISEAQRKTKVQLCRALKAKRKPRKKMARKPRKKVTKKVIKPRKVAKKIKDCISRSNLKLRPHQEKLVRFLMKKRGAIAAFSVGSGKTLTAVTASQCYLDAHPMGEVIIVTPKSLQENFKKEIVAYGANAKDPRYKFYTIGRFTNEYYNKKCPSNALLIIDEAHNLRTEIKGFKGKKGGKRAYTALQCAAQTTKVLLLTATPIYNNPSNILNLVAMVKGEKVPLNEDQLYSMTKQQFNSYFSCVFSFYKSPPSEEYPDLEEKEIRIIMNPLFYRKYRNIEEQNNFLFSEVNPFMFMTGVRQATNALDPCQKCDWAVNKIKEGKKIVLYSAFKTFGIEKIQSMLKGSGIQYVEVTGSMSIRKRNEAVNAFNKKDSPNVLFITKAGGEGLDLKGVRNVIILEAGWNRTGEEQVIGRAVRYKSHTHLPKSERKVNVYHLIIVKPKGRGRDSGDDRPSADVYLKEKIKEKEEVNKVFENRLKDLAIERLKKCMTKGYKPVKEIQKDIQIIKKSKQRKDKQQKPASKSADDLFFYPYTRIGTATFYGVSGDVDTYKIKLLDLGAQQSIGKHPEITFHETLLPKVIEWGLKYKKNSIELTNINGIIGTLKLYDGIYKQYGVNDIDLTVSKSKLNEYVKYLVKEDATLRLKIY